MSRKAVEVSLTCDRCGAPVTGDVQVDLSGTWLTWETVDAIRYAAHELRNEDVPASMSGLLGAADDWSTHRGRTLLLDEAAAQIAALLPAPEGRTDG